MCEWVYVCEGWMYYDENISRNLRYNRIKFKIQGI